MNTRDLAKGNELILASTTYIHGRHELILASISETTAAARALFLVSQYYTQACRGRGSPISKKKYYTQTARRTLMHPIRISMDYGAVRNIVKLGTEGDIVRVAAFRVPRKPVSLF
jgi:hypothetical protein